MHGFPGAIFKIWHAENNEKPKLQFSLTQNLFVLDSQDYHRNIFLESMVSFDRLVQKSLPLTIIIKYKMAANHGRWMWLEQMVMLHYWLFWNN